MKIPDKLQLMGRTIDIIKDNKLCDEKRVYGEARYNLSQILYEDHTSGVPRKKDTVEITVLHEIIHFMFWILEYDNLKDDEKLVGQLSELLYQVITQIEEKTIEN